VFNKNKIEVINKLIREIESANLYCSDEKTGIYFDYDAVIELLKKASCKLVSTKRCLRPKNIPDDIPWCESMNTDDEFSPFVYKADMSIDDFEKAQKACLRFIT